MNMIQASVTSGKHGRAMVLALLLIGLLGGCAAEKIHREGLALLDEGRYEEGLTKLQEAVKEDPDNTSYRIALRRNREQTENRLLLEATEARSAGNMDAARSIYQRILRLDPDHQRARNGLEELAMDERHDKIIAEADSQLKGGDLGAASATLKPVLLEDPRNSQALMLQRKIDEQAAKARVAEPSLKGQFKKTVTLQFSDANIKMVFEALSRVSGVNVLLDKDVKPDIKVSIFVKDVTVEDAIDLIIMQSQLEKKIISDNTIFVYPNIPSKVRDYQDLMIRSFHLTNADPKQMMNMLKTVIKTKDIFLNEKINSIVIRDTPDAIRLAEKMIADQDVAEPEVMMEVEVLEVNRTRLTDFGVKWPDQLTLTATGTGVIPGAVGAAAAATSPTLFQLKHLNSNQIVTSPSMSIALKAMLQDTDTNILASPRIRARNREKAKIMIGDRVPVITNAVTPVATGSPVVTGSVQYLDVGLKLEVEPDIRLNNEVAIKINLDVSSIAKEVQNTLSGTLAYQIGTRNASTMLQLKDGETQILAGLIDNQQRNSASKVPGLGQLPILGHLFSEHNNNGTKTEVILSITPHIVGKVYQPDASEVEYWSGTEDNMHTKPVFLKPVAPVETGTSPASGQPQQPAPAAAPGAAVNGDAVSPLAMSWAGPSQAKVGDKISVTLNTQTTRGLKSLGFLMGFDPSVLKVAEVTKGDFLSQSTSPARLTKITDQTSGQIVLELSSPAPTEVAGSGSVVTIVFEVMRPMPQSQVTVNQILPLDASGKTLAYSAPKPYIVSLNQ